VNSRPITLHDAAGSAVRAVLEIPNEYAAQFRPYPPVVTFQGKTYAADPLVMGRYWQTVPLEAKPAAIDTTFPGATP
jgi:hypothetical protein